MGDAVVHFSKNHIILLQHRGITDVYSRGWVKVIVACIWLCWVLSGIWWVGLGSEYLTHNHLCHDAFSECHIPP